MLHSGVGPSTAYWPAMAMPPSGHLPHSQFGCLIWYYWPVVSHNLKKWFIYTKAGIFDMLYKTHILKHDLKSFSDCPASPTQCCFFPAMCCYHSTHSILVWVTFTYSLFQSQAFFNHWLSLHLFVIILISPKNFQTFWKWRLSLMSASYIAYAVQPIRPHMDNRYSKHIHWVYECRVNFGGQHDTLKIIYLKGTELFFINTKYIWYSLLVYFLIILSCLFSLQSFLF